MDGPLCEITRSGAWAWKREAFWLSVSPLLTPPRILYIFFSLSGPFTKRQKINHGPDKRKKKIRDSGSQSLIPFSSHFLWTGVGTASAVLSRKWGKRKPLRGQRLTCKFLLFLYSLCHLTASMFFMFWAVKDKREKKKESHATGSMRFRNLQRQDLTFPSHQPQEIRMLVRETGKCPQCGILSVKLAGARNNSWPPISFFLYNLICDPGQS